MSLDIKQATLRAIDYLTELFADKRIIQVELEEVELSDDAQFWLITLGFNHKESGPRKVGDPNSTTG